MVSVLQLGMIDYATGLRLQQRLVALRKEKRTGDVLLLLEHDSVITLGRNAKPANVIASAVELAERHVEVFECDRGGDVTFHGEGQLVAYPIFDLREMRAADGTRKTLGAVEYVRGLEEVLIRTCADFGIATQRIKGLTGVWTAPTSPLRAEQDNSPANSIDLPLDQEAKVAAIGVHISRGVTSHGLALNVNTDLSYFNLIIPCGITSKPVTSMARELGREVSMQAVANSVSHNFGIVFDLQMLWLEDLESLLGAPVGIPLKVPAELRQIHKEEDTFWA